MRITWVSIALLAGVAAAMVLRMASGYALPVGVLLLFTSAVALAAAALIISRRRAAYALLLVVFLIGCWRGTDAIPDLELTPTQSEFGSRSATTTEFSRAGMLNRVRQDIANTLVQTIGKSEAGLSIALLTGDRSYLSSDTVANFRAAGMAHLLAISGLHIGLIGGLAMAISVFAFGRRRTIYVLLPLLIVFGYAALAGFAPPVTRAAIMFGVFILGRVLGRGSHTLSALALAAMLMVAFEPVILASLSFQLSFAALLGIAIASPVLEGFTEITGSKRQAAEPSKLTGRIRRFVVGSLVVSIAASVGTLPLVALHFDAVPIWGALATLLAVPAVPIIIIFSAAVAVVANLPIAILPDILAFPVMATTDYLGFIAGFFANLPPRPIQTGSWAVWMAVFYYVAIAVAVLLWPRLAKFREWFGSLYNRGANRVNASLSGSIGFAVVLSTVLLVIATTTWGAALTRNNDRSHLSLRFLQTDHGESIFVETPNGNRMLIDGGGDAFQVADVLGSMLPFWDREIDIVLLTHSDADHVGGLLEVLRRFPVGTVLHSGQNASSNAFSAWSTAVQDHNNAVVVWPGMQIVLDQDLTVEVLASGCPETMSTCRDSNDTSIVTMIRHGNVSFLLTGDIERSAEVRLAASIPDLRATVLKAPHHGSNTSSTATFLNAVEPAAVVVAAGTANRYGHPHPEVIDRLNAAVGEDRVFRNDQLGTVELRTDGQRLWMVR